MNTSGHRILALLCVSSYFILCKAIYAHPCASPTLCQCVIDSRVLWSEAKNNFKKSYLTASRAFVFFSGKENPIDCRWNEGLYGRYLTFTHDWTPHMGKASYTPNNPRLFGGSCKRLSLTCTKEMDNKLTDGMSPMWGLFACLLTLINEASLSRNFFSVYVASLFLCTPK